MKTFVSFLFFFIFSFSVFSQNERGSVFRSQFFVKYESKDSYSFILETNPHNSYDFQNIESTDTLFMELQTEGDVSLEWRIVNEGLEWLGDNTKYYSVDWYKDDELIDLNEGIYTFYCTCDSDDYYANSIIKTREVGAYQLRKIGDKATTLPVVVIYKKEETELSNTKHESIQVYPNPTVGKASIFHGEISEGSAQIVNLQGAIIGQYVLNSSAKKTEINLENISSGTYFILIETDNHIPNKTKLRIQ